MRPNSSKVVIQYT